MSLVNVRKEGKQRGRKAQTGIEIQGRVKGLRHAQKKKCGGYKNPGLQISMSVEKIDIVTVVPIEKNKT